MILYQYTVCTVRERHKHQKRLPRTRLFYSAAVHGWAEVIGNDEVRDIMRITRDISERLHRFGFRRERGGKGVLTCVDKANVFQSNAFFRSIYDAIAQDFPGVGTAHAWSKASRRCNCYSTTCL